jgi:hypothetical protein
LLTIQQQHAGAITVADPDGLAKVTEHPQLISCQCIGRLPAQMAQHANPLSAVAAL